MAAAPSRPATPASPSSDVPLQNGLSAAAAELARVAASADRLQEALSPLLRRGGRAAEAAQALDDITQHLRGLAEFLHAVAGGCAPEWRLDAQAAAARLSLHAQKLRLSTAAVEALPPQTPASTSGELELW